MSSCDGVTSDVGSPGLHARDIQISTKMSCDEVTPDSRSSCLPASKKLRPLPKSETKGRNLERIISALPTNKLTDQPQTDISSVSEETEEEKTEDNVDYMASETGDTEYLGRSEDRRDDTNDLLSGIGGSSIPYTYSLSGDISYDMNVFLSGTDNSSLIDKISSSLNSLQDTNSALPQSTDREPQSNSTSLDSEVKTSVVSLGSCNEAFKLLDDTERPFPCILCGRTFKLRQALQVHSTIHTGEKPFKCEICEEYFRTKLNLQRHIRIHTGEKPFKCDFCGRKFGQKWNLQEHEKIHTGVTPYKCEVCGAQFRVKERLNIHMIKHTGERPYRCKLCQREFKVKWSLQEHMKIHTGEKSFKCDYCDEVFRVKQSLQRHTLIHTGEKPYKCEVCDEDFRMRQVLQRHMRIHTGEKPYMCDLCGKEFNMKWSLQEHVWKHTGEKPFSCDICGNKFAAKRSLKLHTKMHHASDTNTVELSLEMSVECKS